MAEALRFPTTFSGVRPGEAPAIRTLITGAGLSPQDLDAPKLVHFIVARRGDAIVGTVGLEPAGESALLRSLAVAKHSRRQAVATRLVAAVEKYARLNGVHRLYLLTTTAADFFGKQGYREIPRAEAPASIQATEEFGTICPATARCLVKSL